MDQTLIYKATVLNQILKGHLLVAFPEAEVPKPKDLVGFMQHHYSAVGVLGGTNPVIKVFTGERFSKRTACRVVDVYAIERLLMSGRGVDKEFVEACKDYSRRITHDLLAFMLDSVTYPVTLDF